MEEKVIINHFCHEHPLILTENVGNEETPCYGCRKPIISESAYVCSHQYCSSKTTLHKRCAELPKHIVHSSHPDHPLHLFDYQGPGYTYECELCHGEFDDVLGFRCRACDFDIDIFCQQLEFLEEKRIHHPSHRHLLTLMRKPPSLFYCDGCGTEDRDMAYVCSSCGFWLHETCASLPMSIPTNHHKHQLSLSLCFPFEYRKFEFKCGICREEFNITDWVCFCGACRYFAHIKCAISTKAADVINVDEQENDRSGLIQLPVDDISEELISPFIIRARETNGTDKNQKTTDSFTQSFNYHKHPLNLVRERPTEEESTMICDVCVTPIHSPPYYNCATCNTYFLHPTCYSFPKTMRLDSQLYGDCLPTRQNHKLTARPSSELVGNGLCWICKFLTNGMVYECEDCKLSIDVKCASLPSSIKHASHPQHELFLRRLSEEGKRECEACGDELKSRYLIAYYCGSDGCDFSLDLRCVLLPKRVKHEWDKHPLMLTFDASLDHPTDFYCEICEVEMHPKKWMYHCHDCDYSFHFGCLTASGRYRNIKFGRKFDFDHDRIHPHPLEFNRVTLKLRCDACHEKAHKHPGFECELCNYVLCENCGLRELGKS